MDSKNGSGGMTEAARGGGGMEAMGGAKGVGKVDDGNAWSVNMEGLFLKSLGRIERHT